MSVYKFRVNIIILFGFITFAFGSVHAIEKPVKIGVLAHKGIQQCEEAWNPTASYLSSHIRENNFMIVCLPFDKIDQTVKNGDIDFIITNPSIYTELQIKYHVIRIATMQNLVLGKGYNLFGGVIFSRADRTDIKKIEDLRGKKFMAVDKTSFGGWRMAWRELKRHGINPEQDFFSLQFGGTHNKVVYAVRNGVVDAGTVRTDTLERMAEEGEISLQDFKIIPYIDQGPEYENFPLLLSTPLYPEWPIAKSKHVPDRIAKKVASALFNMPKESPAAKSAEIEGWTTPLNYQSIDELLKDLRIGPYENLGRVTLSDIFRNYWKSLIGITIGLCFLISFALYVNGLNKNLEVSQHQLQLQLAEIESLQANLREEAIRDALTGLFNRRYMDEIFERELSRAKRQGFPVSIVMLDIDHFKQLNDTFGHKAGDIMLQKIGEMLKAQTRREDIVCRYGGEEFVVILPGATADVAVLFAERWRLSFQSIEMNYADKSLQATLSAGVAAFPRHGESRDELLQQADKALYNAKETGRNRVVLNTQAVIGDIQKA